MAKFIIEVDDDFIRERADLDLIKKRMETADGKSEFAKMMFDMLAYTSISKKLDEGVAEFRITRDMMDDDTKREYFDRYISDVLVLARMATPDKKSE